MISKLLTPAKQLIWFHVLYSAATGLFGTFYIIVLYRDTNSIAVPFIDMGVRSVSVYISFLLASAAMRRFGYLRVLQTSALSLFFSNAVIAIFRSPDLTSNQLLRAYPYFSFISGLGLGGFWAAYHYMSVHTFKNKVRTYALQTIGWINTLVAVALPLFAGVAVTVTGGARELLWASALISLASVFVPWKSSAPIVRSRPLLEGAQTLYQRPHFLRYVVVLFIDKAQEWLQMTYAIIIPFLVLKSELEVGVFLSVVAFLSAAVVYWRRHHTLEANLGIAWAGQLSRLAGTVLLIAIWNPLVLVVRSIILVAANALSQPVLSDLEARIKQDILGNDSEAHTISLNMIAETIGLIARVASTIIVVTLIALISDIDTFVRVSWAFVAVLSVTSFALQLWLWRCVKE